MLTTMHAKSLTVLFLLSCTHVFAVRPLTGTTAKSLLQDAASVSLTASSMATEGSSASASGSAALTGAGIVVVDARARDVDFTQARDQLAAAVVNAIATDVLQINDLDDIFTIVDAIVPPFAQNIASAFAEATSVQISATGGDANACAQAVTSPDAAAEAAARALVEVLSQASDRISFVNDSEAIDAITRVTVSSFAAAQTRICTNIPSPFTDLAAEIQFPYRDVVLLALVLSHPSTVNDPIVVTVSGGTLSVLTVNGDNFFSVVNGVIINVPQPAFFQIDP